MDLHPISQTVSFRRCPSEYAKGRRLKPADYKIVEAILARVADDGYRMRDIFVEIAMSELMTNR